MSLAVILEEMRQDVTELQRRLANILMDGQVLAVNPGAGRCRFKSGGLETGWVRWMTMRAGVDREWWCPSVGEQVKLLSPDGEPNQGWVLPAAFSDAFPAPDSDPARHVVAYADGMRIVHEPGRLTLDGWDAGGTIELRAKNVVIKTGEDGFYHVDHAGMATRITHKGGNRFETDSWATGTVVVGNPDQGFHSPEVEA